MPGINSAHALPHIDKATADSGSLPNVGMCKHAGAHALTTTIHAIYKNTGTEYLYIHVYHKDMYTDVYIYIHVCIAI